MHKDLNLHLREGDPVWDRQGTLTLKTFSHQKQKAPVSFSWGCLGLSLTWRSFSHMENEFSTLWELSFFSLSLWSSSFHTLNQECNLFLKHSSARPCPHTQRQTHRGMETESNKDTETHTHKHKQKYWLIDTGQYTQMGVSLLSLLIFIVLLCFSLLPCFNTPWNHPIYLFNCSFSLCSM